MLKKEYRLKTRHEFNKTRAFGSYVNSKLFHLYYLPSKEEHSRVGIVVSTKFHKSAVKRNRVKRLLLEVIRKKFDRIRNSFWIVIYPKYSALDKTYEEFSTEFDSVLQKIFVLGEVGNKSL